VIAPADIGPFSSNFLNDWSSFLGPIEGAGAFVAGYVLARRHNCHVKGCMRIGRSPVRGTQFVVCRRHHPLDAPSHQDVLDAHAAAQAAATRRSD
jgi:hypothetical protein